jgi:hypothetical protein
MSAVAMTLLSKAGHALMLTTYARLPEPKVPDYTHVDYGRVSCSADTATSGYQPAQDAL